MTALATDLIVRDATPSELEHWDEDVRQFPNTRVTHTRAWVESLSEDSAASVASMGVEMGAKCVFLPPRPGSPEGLVPTAPGPGVRVLELDVSTLSPMVSLPHSPHGSVPVDELGGRPVDYVFVGACTNGRLEDIA